MAKKTAIIKNARVKSVHVGQVWTEIVVLIPTATVVKRGGKRNPKMPATSSLAGKKAALTKKKKKEALAAAAVAGAGN